MKSFVLGKTKYLLTNSWFGLLLPAGVHSLLNYADRATTSNEKVPGGHRAHPAETRNIRNTGGRNKP